MRMGGPARVRDAGRDGDAARARLRRRARARTGQLHFLRDGLLLLPLARAAVVWGCPPSGLRVESAAPVAGVTLRSWAGCLESVNSLIEELVRPSNEMQHVIGAVADARRSPSS